MIKLKKEIKHKKGTIYFDGELEELFSLCEDGTSKIDTDKVYDWILKSKHITFSSEQVKKDVNKKARKRKIDKLNKSNDEDKI